MRRHLAGQHLHEENAIGKPGKGVHFAKAIGESYARWPFAHNGSTQADDKGQTIKEHMYAIAQQAQGTSHKGIESLDEHEAEIKPARLSGPLAEPFAKHRLTT